MREPRFALDIRVDETTAALFTAGRVTNISRGGLFIETPNPLPIAAHIDLVLQLPGLDTVLKVKGRVAWTYDIRKDTSRLMTGSGIRFVGMSAEQRQLLEAHLARFVPVHSRPADLSASA